MELKHRTWQARRSTRAYSELHSLQTDHQPTNCKAASGPVQANVSPADAAGVHHEELHQTAAAMTAKCPGRAGRCENYCRHVQHVTSRSLNVFFGDCGLSARKIGSLIAQKLGSLSAHKPGHSKRRRVVYYIYIILNIYNYYIYIYISKLIAGYGRLREVTGGYGRLRVRQIYRDSRDSSLRFYS